MELLATGYIDSSNRITLYTSVIKHMDVKPGEEIAFVKDNDGKIMLLTMKQISELLHK